MYKRFADKYERFTFWSNKPNNLRGLAEEKEVLYGIVPPPHDDAVYDYELPYSDASDHVHCTAAALDAVYPATGAPYKIFSEPQGRLIRDAVFTTTQYLFQVAGRVDKYRALGLEDRILDIYKPFARLVDPATP